MNATFHRVKRGRRIRSADYDLPFSWTLQFTDVLRVDGEGVYTYSDYAEKVLTIRLLREWKIHPDVAAELIAFGFWTGACAAQRKERWRRERAYWGMKPCGPLRVELKRLRQENLSIFGGCRLGKTTIHKPDHACSTCKVCRARHHVQWIDGEWVRRIDAMISHGEESIRFPLHFGSCDCLARQIHTKREAIGVA